MNKTFKPDDIVYFIAFNKVQKGRIIKMLNEQLADVEWLYENGHSAGSSAEPVSNLFRKSHECRLAENEKVAKETNQIADSITDMNSLISLALRYIPDDYTAVKGAIKRKARELLEIESE